MPPRCHERTVRHDRNQTRGLEASHGPSLSRRAPTCTSGSVVNCQVPPSGNPCVILKPSMATQACPSSQHLSHSASSHTSHQCMRNIPIGLPSPFAVAIHRDSLVPLTHCNTTGKSTPSAPATPEPCSIAANRRVSSLEQSIFYMILRLSSSFSVFSET